MDILELTVTSCLHLIRIQKETDAHLSIGSGVIIRYRDRFFICTVAHFTDHLNTSIGIITGRVKDASTELYILGDFSYMDQIQFEDLPDVEDLEFVIQNPERSSTRLDIAFREISLLENIYQPKRVFNLSEDYNLTINEGGKSLLIVDDFYEIDTTEFCSFYGRIRPNFQNGVLDYQEQLYWGLPIVSLSEDFIKMDLGSPIRDYSRFKGCSGAPIIDTRGRLIGILTHGDIDLNSPFIYGFRFDKVKQWIDLMYFQEPISKF